MFPYEPFDPTDEDIEDFSYTLGDETVTRRARFDDDGRLEHLAFSWQSPAESYAAEFSVLRCGGVIVETTRVPEVVDDNVNVNVNYYGCDDFVLPELPELPL
jgi:hypothetical protein